MLELAASVLSKVEKSIKAAAKIAVASSPRYVSMLSFTLLQANIKGLKEPHLNFYSDVPPIELYQNYLEDEKVFSYNNQYRQAVKLNSKHLWDLLEVRTVL